MCSLYIFLSSKIKNSHAIMSYSALETLFSTNEIQWSNIGAIVQVDNRATIADHTKYKRCKEM